MIVTRMDANAQPAIPAEVLDALGVKPGDEIGFDIADGVVSVFRNPADDEIDSDTGMTMGELRALIAEGLKGPTIPIEEAFAQVRAHIDEVARRSDAA